MHPEASELPGDSAAESSLDESTGDHGDAGPGVCKEGATALGNREGEGPCVLHVPIHAAESNQHPSHMPIYTARRTVTQQASHKPISTAGNSQRHLKRGHTTQPWVSQHSHLQARPSLVLLC